MRQITTLDFETEAIVNGAPLMPKPVGFAYHSNDAGPARYYAWGHPTENNCTEAEARAVYAKSCANDIVLMHNAKFDIRVGVETWGIEPQHEVYDTMLMAFLYNPHFKLLGLKPLSALLLDMPALEAEELRDWLIKHTEAKANNWGAYIAKAPGLLVGRYAVGDVVRTRALYDYFLPTLLDDDAKVHAA